MRVIHCKELSIFHFPLEVFSLFIGFCAESDNASVLVPRHNSVPVERVVFAGCPVEDMRDCWNVQGDDATVALKEGFCVDIAVLICNVLLVQLDERLSA